MLPEGRGMWAVSQKRMMIRDNKEQANVDRRSVFDLYNTFIL